MIKSWYRFLNPRFQNLFLEYKTRFTPRYGHGKPPHPELYEIIDKNREQYAKLLKRARDFDKPLAAIQKNQVAKEPVDPEWNNGFLPGLDIVGIYLMMAHFKPKTYLEVGSGNSTKVAAKAVREQQLDTRIISVDPEPRAEIDQLAQDVIREPFENLDPDRLPELGKNDILFIDNSHRILPNSDATAFFLETLPRLKPGVIVHIHDVYLPYDYPQFMCDRFYSEQYGLALCLLANPKRYQPLLPNFFISEDPELSDLMATFWENDNLKGVERHGGSFWLRIGKG